MVRKILAMALVLVLGVSLAGCVTESGYYQPVGTTAVGALGGAVTGAALGAIIGAATGNAATGAWVGAATGAVVGGVGGALYARHQNNQIRNAQMAAQNYNYTPAYGNVVDINRVDAIPAQVRPGEQVLLRMEYTILTPYNSPVAANLMREVRLGEYAVGQPYQTQVTNYNGTYTDQVGFALPGSAVTGTYTVTTRVVSSYGAAERNAYFTVY